MMCPSIFARSVTIWNSIENPISTFTTTFDNPIDERNKNMRNKFFSMNTCDFYLQEQRISFHFRIGEENQLRWEHFMWTLQTIKLNLRQLQ